MNTHNVQGLCRQVWEAREKGTLTPDDTVISRAIYRAAAADIDEGIAVKYDPEMDRRIEWLREIARKVRIQRRGLRAEADPALEDLMLWILWRKREVSPKHWADR